MNASYTLAIPIGLLPNARLASKIKRRTAVRPKSPSTRSRVGPRGWMCGLGNDLRVLDRLGEPLQISAEECVAERVEHAPRHQLSGPHRRELSPGRNLIEGRKIEGPGHVTPEDQIRGVLVRELEAGPLEEVRVVVLVDVPGLAGR